MASAPELDIAALTAPIPGDSPSGPRVPFTLRQKLEAARKDFEPNPDDPSGAPIPKKPDWSGIVRLSTETLTNTSKDLETALRMTEAMARMHGFGGLKESFKLLQALVDNCWDFLHPIPDPEDGEGQEIRGERFNWIGDKDAGARFPHTIREIPLVRVDGRPLSMRERQMAYDGKIEGITSDDMERAQLASDTIPQEVADALQGFNDLDAALNAKLEGNAPGLIGLREALEEIKNLVDRMDSGSGRGQSDETSSEQAPGDNGEAEGGGGGPGMRAGLSLNVGGSVQSREDAYRLIEQIASALERIEPHSPIPDLLRRALDLGRMPFRRLIRELIRDTGNLAQVYREFGIKEDAGQEASAPSE